MLQYLVGFLSWGLAGIHAAQWRARDAEPAESTAPMVMTCDSTLCTNPYYPSESSCSTVVDYLTDKTIGASGIDPKPLISFAGCYTTCCNITSLKGRFEDTKEALSDFETNPFEEDILKEVCKSGKNSKLSKETSTEINAHSIECTKALTSHFENMVSVARPNQVAGP